MSPGVWSRRGSHENTVYASSDGVLVTVTGALKWEGDLLTVLSTFRPVDFLELASAR